MPPEESVLFTAYNAKAVLMAGFTSCFSAASTRLRNDVVIRNEINDGRIIGPRLRAASPEITATGSLGDANRVHQERESFGIVFTRMSESCTKRCPLSAPPGPYNIVQKTLPNGAERLE